MSSLEHTSFQIIRQYFIRQSPPLVAALGAIAGCGWFIARTTSPTQFELWSFAIVLCGTTLFLPKFSRLSWQKMVAIGVISFSFFTLYMAAYTHIKQQNRATLTENTRTWVTGYITEKYRKDNGRIRLTLQQATVYSPKAELPAFPLTLRISGTDKNFGDFNIGDGIAVQTKLHRTRTPAFPQDYDTRLTAFFENRAASGFVMGDVYATNMFFTFSLYLKLANVINGLRQNMSNRVKVSSNGVVAALLVGEKSFIDAKTKEDYRKSGLAHLLAISGLHLGMIGGMIFFSLRYLAACVPAISLRYNTKAYAAFFALLGSGIYMFLAGSSLPTIRAFIMLALLFGAVLVQRVTHGLRALSFAAIFVLLLWPYSVVSASFQMSFLATFALLIWARCHQIQEDGLFQAPKRIRYIQTIFACSIVAGFATFPLAVAHFGMLSLSGFIANLVAIPLMGIFIMPLAILTLLFWTVNLQHIPLWAMEKIVDLLNLFAAEIAQWHTSGLEINPHWWGLIALCSAACIASYVLRQYKLFFVASGIFVSILILLQFYTPYPHQIITLNYGKIALWQHQNIAYTLKQPEDHDGKYTLKRYLTTHKLTQKPAPATCDSEGCMIDNTLISFLPVQPEMCQNSNYIIHLSKVFNTPCSTIDATQHAYTATNVIQQTTKTFTPNTNRSWQKP